MAKHVVRLAAGVALLAICGGHGASATSISRTDAEQAIETLRVVYAGPNPYGVFKSRDREVLSKVLTPALVETWAGPEADGPQSDGSPIAWSQMTDSAKLATVTPHGFSQDRGMLDATVDAVVEGRHITKKLTWDMHRVNGRWLADDIHSGRLSFRTMFAGFAPAKAPAQSNAVRGPVPLRMGEYKIQQANTCFGMIYWSNRITSGLTVNDKTSSLDGYNCMGRFSRQWQDYILRGRCTTGNGRYAPPPKNATVRISVIDETSFRFNDTIYHWCETPDYLK